MSRLAPPTPTVLAPGEELWIIAKPKTAAARASRDDALPGSGVLQCAAPAHDPLAPGVVVPPAGGEAQMVPVPLKHTKVSASISGYIGAVEVQQQFENPFATKIEAVYVFPLPTNAAVSEFVMTVGERKIRGIVREREEADRIYTEARNQGYVASILTEERPNIFTQKVANIEPGKRIDISITYFHTLAYIDGEYEFVFPMVVGPRFNPPGSSGGVGAVARGAAGGSGQKTEVQYLRPTERSGHDINLAVSVDAGVPIESVTCTTHSVRVDRVSEGQVRVALNEGDRIPNKDFVLRYRVASDSIKSGFLAHHDERGGFFTLMLFPPSDLTSLPRQPMEMVFVLDCSGSMNGEPLEQARAAVRHALRKLDSRDSFQIIRFSNNASSLGPAPLPATPENVASGLRYLTSLQSEGGTMMIEGIKTALDFAHDPERLRFVVFLTDGYIGNEAEIFRETHQRLGESRIFSFGVGSSVNRYLLEGLANIGKGALAYVGHGEKGDEVMDRFLERASHPALANITIDWGGLTVSDVYPQTTPDLFIGRPVILTGRCASAGEATVRITGRAGGKPIEIVLPANLNATDGTFERRAIAQVWARTRIAWLSAVASALGQPGEAKSLIERTALDFGLLSAYTAFVAVDSLAKTAGEYGTTVVQPVAMPQGVRYETTVTETQ